MAVANVLVQVGCLTVLLILGALGAGLWLDARFDTRPLFTLVLVLGSVPVTIYLLFRIVMAGMRRLQRDEDVTGSGPAPAENEEAEGGRNP